MHCENVYPHFSANSRIRIYRRKPYLTQYSSVSYPNIDFVDLPSTRIKGFEAVYHTFLCCLHVLTHRVDVVHVHNIGPGMFIPLLKLMRMRVCLTYHSPNYEHKKWGRVARAILRMGEYLSLNFADTIIFVNKFQMQKYSAKVQAKAHYIPNGMAEVSRSVQTDYLEQIGVMPGRYLLGVGRLTPEKGFGVLIEAANALPDVEHVVIAGASDHDTAYYETLKAKDRGHKAVFTGFTTGEDLRQLYSHARLFVLSSINEGFPLVLLEAMGYGLPMVVSDIPATHLMDLPEDDYARVGDASEFAKKIGEKLKQAETAHEYDLASFRWPRIAEMTEDILTK